uniref:Uncharacterized protein n=1 Tax=Anguilla anguilla TaxID=7936 RepID=A0A0E9S761_ANGAN
MELPDTLWLQDWGAGREFGSPKKRSHIGPHHTRPPHPYMITPLYFPLVAIF